MRGTVKEWMLGMIPEVQQLQNELSLARTAIETQTRWHRATWEERDAARDEVDFLKAELETLRKTNGMFRSLIAILRDVNRELDERNVHLEQIHGMTPGERFVRSAETEVTA